MGRPWPPIPAENGWRHLVAHVLGAQIACESDDDAEPAGALRNRWCQSRPLNGISVET